MEKSVLNSKLAAKLESLRGTTRRQAKYEIIRDFLLEELKGGVYAPGDALPSENQLIAKLGVARNTVRQAIDELATRGVVRRVQGKGNFFVGRRSDDKQLAVFSLILPEISHSLYPPLAKGFDNQAGLRQRQILLCNTDFDVNKQGNLVLQMIEKNVAGVALVPALSAPTPAFHVRQLQLHNIPVVLCHRPVAEVSAPLVTWDAAKVARLAGRTLAGLGHRRIAYFARTRYNLTEMHERSLRQTLEESGLELPGNYVCYGESPVDLDAQLEIHTETLEPLVKCSKPVTAIFCNDDNEAEVVYFSLGKLGVRIPEDVSLMGFGDSRFRSGAFFSRLSSVVIDEYKLGSRAAELLHEMQTGQRPIDSGQVIYKQISLWEGRTIAAV